MAHGIVWGSFAKSTIGCGPVFNAPRQQQENPSIHVIHCGLDSKNMQKHAKTIFSETAMLPFGMLRADRQGLYQDVLKKHWRDFLKKSVVAWLNFQMQSAIPMTTHTCARAIFLNVVGRDNCAFHAPRGLAVN